MPILNSDYICGICTKHEPSYLAALRSKMSSEVIVRRIAFALPHIDANDTRHPPLSIIASQHKLQLRTKRGRVCFRVVFAQNGQQPHADFIYRVVTVFTTHNRATSETHRTPPQSALSYCREYSRG